ADSLGAAAARPAPRRLERRRAGHAAAAAGAREPHRRGRVAGHAVALTEAMAVVVSAPPPVEAQSSANVVVTAPLARPYLDLALPWATRVAAVWYSTALVAEGI